MKNKELKPPTGATKVCPLVFIKSPEWIKSQTGFNSPGTSYWIEDTELSVFSPWRVTCCPEQYHLHLEGRRRRNSVSSDRFCRRRLVTLVYHLSACFNARPGLWRRPLRLCPEASWFIPVEQLQGREPLAARRENEKGNEMENKYSRCVASAQAQGGYWLICYSKHQSTDTHTCTCWLTGDGLIPLVKSILHRKVSLYPLVYYRLMLSSCCSCLFPRMSSKKHSSYLLLLLILLLSSCSSSTPSVPRPLRLPSPCPPTGKLHVW